MAIKAFNSIGGFSVGENAANIILANGEITTSNANLSANLYVSDTANVGNLRTNNLLYANGNPWDIGGTPAGSNTQIQFNNDNEFGASANFTFNSSTNLLTITGNVNATNADLGNLVTANFFHGVFDTTSSNQSNITALGNLSFLNVDGIANLANVVNITGNVNASANITANANITGANLNTLGLANIGNLEISGTTTGNLIPSANVTFNLGNATNRWKDLFLSGSSILIGDQNISSNAGGIALSNTTFLTELSVSGNANVSLNIAGNTANFTGNVVAANLTANSFVFAPAIVQNAGTYNTRIELNSAAGIIQANTAGNVTQFLPGGSRRLPSAGASDIIGGSYDGSKLTLNDTGAILSQSRGANVKIEVGTGGTIANTWDFNNNGNTTFPAAGAVNLGNLATANFVTVSSNLDVTNTANVGNLRTNNLLYANGTAWDFITPAGANTEIQFNDGNGNLGASANFTFNNSTNLLTVTGNSNVTGNITASYYFGNGSLLTGVVATAADKLANGNTTVTTALNGNVSFNIADPANSNVPIANLMVLSSNLLTVNANITTTGTISANNFSGNFSGNISGNVTIPGSNTGIVFNDQTFANSSLGFTFDKTSNVANLAGALNVGNSTVNVSISTGNVVATNNITAVNFIGTIAAGANTITTTGNANVGNLGFGTGEIIGTGNISVGNITTTSVNASVTVNALALVSPTLTSNTTTLTLTAAAGNNDVILVPTGTGAVSISSKKIINLATPTLDNDAATKAYVDSVAQGLDPKASVVYATAAGLPAYTYNNGTSGIGATITGNAVGALSIDGSAVSANERVLIKNETTTNSPYNGIYVVTTAGSGGTAYVLTRTTDFDSASPSGEIPGAFVFVEYGTTNADTGWVCTTNAPVTVGTTDIVFVQFSGAGAFTANTSAGLVLIGTQFNAKVDGNSNPTTAFDGNGNIYVPANAAFTTPNIGAATGTSVIVTGGVTANTLTANLTLSVTGNANVGNLGTAGLIIATGNIDGGNINTIGSVTASGNGVFGNISTAGAGGNITGANVIAANTLTATGNVNADNFVGNTAQLSSGTLTTSKSAVNVSQTWNNASATFTGILENITDTNSSAGSLLMDLQVGGVSKFSVSKIGNVTVGNLSTGALSANSFSVNSLAIGNTAINANTVTTSSITANQTIATFQLSGSNVTGVEFLVKGYDTPGAKYSVATVLAVTDGNISTNNVDYTIYGTVRIGTSTGALAVNINAGNIALQVTPTSSNATVWTTQIRTI
jgi:hypothetical protein